MSFIKKWWQGTKKHANSPSGGLQTALIINGFIVLGCFLGSYQMKVSNGYTAITFVVFAFGVLQLFTFFQQLKQYKLILKQEKMFKELEVKEEEQ